MFRIYYHLYLGASWKDVWALHWPLLERFAASGMLDRLVLCVYGGDRAELSVERLAKVEVRPMADTLPGINEFNTLREMQRDAWNTTCPFDYCVYLHSKGSSSFKLSSPGAEWSFFLAKALLSSLPEFPRVVEMGFNCLGSNLALGVFEDFGMPRLHYSGNFWCTTRAFFCSAPEITLRRRETAIRHNAEWLLDRMVGFTPFNLFCTGINHYASPPRSINWNRLEDRLLKFAGHPVSPAHEMLAIKFLRDTIARAMGSHGVRRIVSEALLQVLPHHRWHRLLHVHDILMRALGSRKSVYFYCPESV